MQSKFRHVALIGKYQAVPAAAGASSRRRWKIAHFLHAQGCEVALRA
jgi:NAD+ kinase